MASSEFDGIRAQFRSLLGENHRKMQRKALKEVGTLIGNAVKRRAPARAGEYVSSGVLRPGELAASIKQHVHVPTDEQALAGKPSGVVVAPEGRVYGIAVAIEHGHPIVRGGKRTRAGRTGSVVGNVPAHPFIRPARDETQDEAEELYEASLVADIQKAME